MKQTEVAPVFLASSMVSAVRSQQPGSCLSAVISITPNRAFCSLGRAPLCDSVSKASAQTIKEKLHLHH